MGIWSDRTPNRSKRRRELARGVGDGGGACSGSLPGTACWSVRSRPGSLAQGVPRAWGSCRVAPLPGGLQASIPEELACSSQRNLVPMPRAKVADRAATPPSSKLPAGEIREPMAPARRSPNLGPIVPTR